jgi:hypothetical protein
MGILNQLNGLNLTLFSMSNTNQRKIMLGDIKMRNFSKVGVNLHPDTRGYVVPLWIQEVLQELKYQNKKRQLTGQSKS